MTGQYTDFWNSKAIVGVAIADFLLATLIYRLDGAAQGCGLFANTTWVALELFRLAILLAHWAAASVYLYEISRFLQHQLQFEASVLPLLCAAACWA